MLPSRAIIWVMAAASGVMVVPPSSLTVNLKGNPQAATSPPLGSAEFKRGHLAAVRLDGPV